jgi:hypothetical protein
LVHLGEQKLQQGMQHKAFVKLLGLQYKVQYKKGLENNAADALSWQEGGEVNTIFICTPKWLETVVEAYQQDPQAQQLLQELSLVGHNDKGYALVDGVIRYKGRIWLGSHTEAHQAIIACQWSQGP